MVWGETTDFCFTANTLKMNSQMLQNSCELLTVTAAECTLQTESCD